MSFKPFEVLGDPSEPGPFVFTCEHAANRLPPELEASADDRKLLEDHWGWDLGARELCRALRRELGGVAVLSRFSRLVIDANRAPDEASAILTEIAGQVIDFNRGVDAAERARRARSLHAPYHDAIDAALRERRARPAPFCLLSIHSFTPSYLGRRRPMEIGVLFDDFDDDALALAKELAAQGFESSLNAPYSGKPPDGLIYAARRHGRAHGIEYLELEVRQDSIATPEHTAEVAGRIAAALRRAIVPNLNVDPL